MKQIIKMAGLFSLLWLLAACQSETALDTSSKEAIEASAKAMAIDLPDEKKEMFKESIAGIYMIGSLKGVMEGKDKKAIVEDINRQIDGMTADEIIAYANKIKEEMKK